jgi:hypothetical protein
MITALYEKKLRGDLFKLSILTLVTVLLWVGVATYKALSKSQVKPDVKKQLIPLTPTVDLDTMESIKQRRQVPLAAWKSIQPGLPGDLLMLEEPAATSSAEPEVEASPSAELESAEATSSAGE